MIENLQPRPDTTLDGPLHVAQPGGGGLRAGKVNPVVGLPQGGVEEHGADSRDGHRGATDERLVSPGLDPDVGVVVGPVTHTLSQLSHHRRLQLLLWFVRPEDSLAASCEGDQSRAVALRVLKTDTERGAGADQLSAVSLLSPVRLVELQDNFDQETELTGLDSKLLPGPQT